MTDKLLISRLTNRFFPDLSEWELSLFVRYGLTLLGALTWATSAVLFLLGSGLGLGLGASNFERYWDLEWIIIFLSVTFLPSIFFSILIVTSFKRGTPLNFYLWGLAYPLVVTNLLKFTFS